MLLRLPRIILIALLAASTSFAQQTDEEKTELSEAMKARVDQMVRREEMRSKDYMKMVIGNLKRTCDLDEKQVKRLTLAARGATERTLEKYRKNMTNLYGARNRAAVAGGFATLTAPIIVSGGAAFPKESLWKKAVETTLTESQLKQWQAEEKSRKDFNHRVALDNAVSMVDAQVLLSKAQRKALRDWMTENLPKEFPQSNGAVAYANASRFILPALVDYPEADLKKLLDETQLKAWDTFIGRYRNLRRGVNAARALPALQAVPAQRAAPVRRPVPAKRVKK